jgi:hypothetical protein
MGASAHTNPFVLIGGAGVAALAILMLADWRSCRVRTSGSGQRKKSAAGVTGLYAYAGDRDTVVAAAQTLAGAQILLIELSSGNRQSLSAGGGCPKSDFRQPCRLDKSHRRFIFRSPTAPLRPYTRRSRLLRQTPAGRRGYTN